MKVKLKHKSLALLLAVTIMLGVCLPMLASAAEDTSGGFEIGMFWNMTDSNTSADQLSYTYASNKDETKALRLAVRYQNKNMGDRVYAPGEVVLTVKGIGGAFRDGAQVADSVAADKASESSKSYAWSYTYSSTTDTYTFINNNTLSSLENFAGSFELLWLVSSRTSIADYSTTLQAELIASGGVKVQSNSVSYTQSRVRDDFTLRQEADRIYTAEGYASGLNEADYWWISFTARSQQIERSLGVNASYMEVLLPQGAAIAYVTGKASFIQMGTETVNGVVYNIWRISRAIHDQANGTASLDYIVRYDKSVFPAEAEIHGSIRTVGTFNESTAAEILATYQLGGLYFGEFEFIENVPGNIYWGEKEPLGTGKNSAFAWEHCDECAEYGYIDSRHFVNGGGNYTFTLKHKLNYLNMYHQFYDWMITDDAVEAETLTGEYRKLKETEFSYKTLMIPAVSEILNFNGVPLQSGVYPYSVYVKTAVDGAYSLLKTGVLGAQDYITLPANTCGFQIKFENLTENITKLEIPVTINFNIGEGSDLKPKDNTVYNTMMIDLYLYDADGSPSGHTKENPLVNPEDGVPGDTLYFYANMHVLEVPNFYQSTTSLAEFGDVVDGYRPSTVSVGTNFIYNEGEPLQEFGIYTILPKGLHLPRSVVDAESLIDIFEITGFSGVSKNDLLRALTIDLDTNYQGSGRTYIAFYFKFQTARYPGNAFTASIRINFPVQLPLEDYFSYGPSFQVTSVSRVYDTELRVDPSSGIAEDDGFYANIDERSLWRDINQNGDTEEALSFSNSIRRELVQAAAMEAGISKLVATESTGNRFVQPVQTDGDYDDDEIPMASTDGTYVYRLRVAPNSQQKDTFATDIVLFDVLETGPNAKWKGEIVSIDTSAAEALLTKVNDRTITAKVYYSNIDYNSAINAAGNGVYKPDLSTSDWSETPNPTAKTIAVSFGDAELTGSEYLTVDITMRAPDVQDDDPIMGEITENIGGVYYREVNTLAISDEEIWLPSNPVPVKLRPFMATVTIIKTDKEDGTLLTGAVFDLYKQLGASPVPAADEKLYEDLTTNVRGRIVLRNLEAGTYYLMETSPPPGYIQITTPIVFVVDTETTITLDVENTRKDGTVTLYKTSDRNDIGLAGAVFQLYTSDGTLYRDNLVVPPDGRLTLNDLPWGSYYFVEVTPPDGFELPDNNKFPFEISAENDAGELAGLITVVNKQLPASAIMTKLEKLEDGTVTANPLRGASYRLYDHNDKDLGIYVTDADGKIYLDDIAIGSYYFKEVIPAPGYELYAEKIPFEVTAEHTRSVLEFTTYDQRSKGNVWLQKLDDAGDFVQGAVYGLYKTGEDTPMDTKTTDSEGILEFKDLFWGSYYIKEISSPTGYELDTTVYPIEINAQTASATIVLNVVDNRLQGKVRLVKTDETGNILLNGAKFNLYHADGTLAAGPLTTGADGENGIIEVDGLDWGSYYFQEIEAPAGYGLSDEKIRFSISAANASTTVEVDAINVLQGKEITIIKEIDYDDLVFAHGNPTFTYKISGTDVNGTARVWYKAITFSKAYADVNVSGGKVRGSFTLTVPAGTYTAVEVEMIRYELDGVKELTSPNVTTPDGKSAVFNMTGSYETGSATFVNDKVKQSGTSDTAQIVNIVKTGRKLVSISAVYHGVNPVPDGNINKDDITVTAFYDDGSERVLASHEFTLEHDEFDGVNSSYTITVVYTERGVTRKAYFDIRVSGIEPLFLWEIQNGEAIILAYKGASSIVNFPSEVTGVWTDVVKDYSKLDPDKYSGGTYTDDGNIYPVKVIGDGEQAWPVKQGTTQVRFSAGGSYHIAQKAFYGLTSLTSVSFAEGVSLIGDYAFAGCTGLTGNLTLPNSLEKIGDHAFENAGYTGNLLMGSGLQEIGSYAFSDVNFGGKLAFPASMRNLGHFAFACTGSMQSIEIDFGTGVELIGINVFGGRTVTNSHLLIPDSVITIESEAFCYTTFPNNPTLYLGNSIQKIGAKAFYKLNITGDLILFDSVIEIGESAFEQVQCSGGFRLSQSVETLGKRAFYKMDGVFTTDVEIPETLEIIPEYAFYYFRSNANLVIHGENLKRVEQYAFYVNRVQFTDWFRGVFSGLPDTVEYIGNYAFAYQQMLEWHNPTLPASLTFLGDNAFSYWREMTGVLTVPGGVKVWPGAISYAQKIEEIIFEEGVEEIDQYGLYYNTSVRKVTFPKSIKSIHSNGIYGMTEVGTVEFGAPTNMTTFNSAFTNIGLKGHLEIPYGVETVSGGSNNPGLTSVTIPDSVKSITGFSNNPGITSLYIPGSVNNIGTNAFAFTMSGVTSSLKKVEIGATGPYLTIGSGAFNKALTNLEEPLYIPYRTLTMSSSTTTFAEAGANSSLSTVIYFPNQAPFTSNVYGAPAGRYAYY